MGAIREVEKAAIEFIARPTRERFYAFANLLGERISDCPVASTSSPDLHFRKACDVLECPMAGEHIRFFCAPSAWPQKKEGAKAIAELVERTMAFVTFLGAFDD